MVTLIFISSFGLGVFNCNKPMLPRLLPFIGLDLRLFNFHRACGSDELQTGFRGSYGASKLEVLF